MAEPHVLDPEAGPGADPGRDCALCPRLVALRVALRGAHPAGERPWHNAPVPSFGPLGVRLLIVGLAPGRNGANRTGRPFTGDGAGELLYPALGKHGFARGTYGADPDDGIELIDCRITNTVRCLPPGNKPTGAEIATCSTAFLRGEIAAMPHLRAILSLGRIAHDATARVLGCKPVPPFGHGAVHAVTAGGRQLVLVNSYHCSRYNLNTGRLTLAMFDAVLLNVKRKIA